MLIGPLGLIDPPRAEAAVAITQAHSAGIRVIMITGDHPRTAARIAADLGLVGAPADRAASVLTGAQLDALDAAGLAAAVRSIAVYASVASAHKLRIVAALLFGLQGGAGSGAVVLPLLATQLLWIHLMTDSAPALAFGVDPPVGDLMARPPCWCWPACSTA